jgi:hypothetical protein
MIKINCEWIKNWSQISLSWYFLCNPKPFNSYEKKKKDFLIIYITKKWKLINEPQQSSKAYKKAV